MTALRVCLGVAFGLIVRLWLATLRVRFFVHPDTDFGAEGSMVFCFWHGQQMLILRSRARRRRPRAVMVSWSRDGAIQAGVMKALGFLVVRGSSSRGGAAGLRRLLNRLEAGADAAFAVDGPRGPIHRPKTGAALAAEQADARLVPVGAFATSKWVLSRTWDRFEIPVPFSRVAVVVGAPVAASAARADPDLLAWAVEAARATAKERSSPMDLPTLSLPSVDGP